MTATQDAFREKIRQIKNLREIASEAGTPLGLKDAKDVVEQGRYDEVYYAFVVAATNKRLGVSESGIFADDNEVAAIVRINAAERFTNNTSRLRKFTCACEEHVVDDQTGKTAPGPKILRGAASLQAGMGIFCNDCAQPFTLDDSAAKRRLYRGCKHCTNPDEHEHGAIEEKQEAS